MRAVFCIKQFGHSTSALCQKQTSSYALFDHLIGETQQPRRDCDSDRFRRIEVDRQHHLGREFYRQFAGRCAVQNLVHRNRRRGDSQRKSTP